MKRFSFWLLSMALIVGLACSGDPDKVTVTITGSPDVDDDGPAPSATVVRVPQDQPTIQAGIDVADAGDTVLVSDGTYTGDGNRDIQFGGKAIVLRSHTGPLHTIIDFERSGEIGFNIQRAGDSAVIIDGFTITGGNYSQGGAFVFRTASPTIRNCVIVDNIAYTSGGAFRCKGASPVFESCTFANNESPNGGTAYLLNASSPRFDNCVIAFSRVGEAIVCDDDASQPVLTCCNVFGNEGGDWTGCLADMSGVDGNLSADPLFCDTLSGNFQLEAASPCVAEYNDCGELIGALEAACD